MRGISGPIAVVAPCSIHREDRFHAGIQLAAGLGFELQPFADLLRPHLYLAGDDDHRLAQLSRALSDDRFSAVWIARGGCGMTRLLPRLDFDNFRPKPVIGFSDVTALLAALHQHGLGPAIHGPVVHSLPITDVASMEHLERHLKGLDTPPLQGEIWREGTAEGALMGGNLSLLAALCGTPWQPSARGKIVVLEEVAEPAYRIDRLLQQLHSAGVLGGAAGVALGKFEGCKAPEGFTLKELILEQLAPLGVPVVAQLPIGHGAENRAWTLGTHALLRDGSLTWQGP
jgi:muramoyltetrapeptide carboxypeptidase